MKQSFDHSIALSILIVNWNTRQDLLSCLASIKANPPTCEYEVLVFDNASADGSAEAVAAQFPDVRLAVSSENLGFARANNRVASLAEGQFWLLLNPDTIVHPGALDVLMGELAQRARAAAVGPRLVNLDGSLQPSVERLPSLFREWWRLFHLDRFYPISQYPQGALDACIPQNVEVLSGACMLLRRAAIKPGGIFDEGYFVYSEEIDLCDRLQQEGWELRWVPDAMVTHLGGRSTRQVADPMFIELYRNKVKFFRKRRGQTSAWFYKLILLHAALIRYGIGNVVSILPLRRRKELMEVGRQYRLLLTKLPGL